MSVAETVAYTPEDLLTLSDGERYELVEGQLVEKPMGAESDAVATEISGLIRTLIHHPRAGWLFGAQTGYSIFGPAGDGVRKPDVSFIRLGRLPGERIPQGHIDIPPDLAVEVVYPNELYSDVEAKVREYLAAGVQLVWIVDPRTRTVRVLRGDGSSASLTETDKLSGEEIVPGLSVQVSENFPPLVM